MLYHKTIKETNKYNVELQRKPPHAYKMLLVSYRMHFDILTRMIYDAMMLVPPLAFVKK